MKKVFNLFLKDFNSELRNRYSINSLFMFVIVAISIMLFSIGNESVPEEIFAGLYWVIVFFTAMTGLSRVFITEEERGTNILLSLIAKPTTIFLGKFFFNLVLIFALNIVITFFSLILFKDFNLKSFELFIIGFILGNYGFAITSTLIAAIITKANAKGTLYPVLSFPILLPLILVLMQITKASITGSTFAEIEPEVVVLISYNVIITTASILLFDLIWKD